MSPRPPDAGLILVNVLVALALGATLVTLMLTSQETAIDRARLAGAADQALALALGAETSVLVALRRDMAEAPEADSLAEPWAKAAQAEVTLATGTFQVTIADAQGRLDLNGLVAGGVVQEQALARLAAVLELPEATPGLILAGLRDRGPLRSLAEVEGLDATARAALALYVAFLPPRGPVPGAVNLNSADPVLIGALLGSPTAARRLAALRARDGALVAQDLTDLGLLPGGLVGFTSDAWDVTVRAEVDGVTARLASRLLRLRRPGVEEVVVASRRIGGAGDLGADLPPLPDR